MEKIVILDGATLGNVSLEPLKQFGKIEFYAVTNPNETKKRIQNAEIIITNKVIIREEELQAAKKLKLICVAATGYNNIDTQAAKRHNVVVANVKNYSDESVAQYVFAHILAIENSIIAFQNTIKNGAWSQSPIFTMLDFPIFELKNKNLGIIGFGNIGKRVAEIGKAFGMNILVAKRKNKKYNDDFRTDFETVLRESDILTIHTPLTPETENMLTYKELSMMKPTAILVNAARGGIVNEYDLFKALKDKKIKAAVVDVLTLEPPTEGNILFSAPNIIITPHIAWTSAEARKKLIEGIAKNIKLFSEGQAEKINVAK